ncbi:hypothetical protein PHYBLDRAFT_159658 [Phycomyces blakesleeanus NRRL 1555(-)]|uniref:Uncharacterized protein n=1 Tax=Phycomyces blakesleeanus (strain ATCC 8743b / DSM 1359 / FGSC 10004 / NBRC 33097 / NRRL 1555) TaxID=763407 RepID=A0A163A118_PHYB8|nr:hypothetical protein PHYBLDRAFT_159658 [Phycomyces blakesleeanus NRRL 1555(-)]OAD70351.1 hypothetical protein PHYBLDRAFT_159658 [Phycomyces blakesleeanus NRRL 1555(-)]|eukprot:XP_018288391.1 hypothetical protein PHYBLDRAFT_159658 [Phycomyces blakesleeanus NRRL 1555(-)]
MRVASASPKVVVLSADRRGGKWQSMKKTPDYQYQTQQSVIHTLKQRSEQLRSKMHQLQKDQDDSSIYVPPSGTKTLHQSLSQGHALLSQSLAKIQIPRLSSIGKARHCIQLQSAAEFERIHSIFIR